MTPPTATPTVARVVAANLRRLRDERDWTQPEVAARLHMLGYTGWTFVTIAKIETGLRRADHVTDLAGLCEVFDVPAAEFLAGDTTVAIANGTERSLHQIRLALAGMTPRPSDQPWSQVADDWDLDRVVELAGLDSVGDLRMITYALWGRQNFLELRDERAGLAVKPGKNRLSTSRRRGAATRGLLAEMQAAITERGANTLVQDGIARLRAMADVDDTGEDDANDTANVQFPECPECGAAPGQAHDPTCSQEGHQR